MKTNFNLNTFTLICCFIGIQVFFGCKSSSEVTSEALVVELYQLEQNLNNKPFSIDIKTAYPFNSAGTINAINSIILPNAGNNANRIDVKDDGHYVAFNNKNVEGNLPYFGEARFSAGHYGGIDQSIKFKGAPKVVTIAKHRKKQACEIYYEISDTDESTENYKIKLLIFPDHTVHINIIPSLRNTIRYRGKLNFINTSTASVTP